MPLWEAASQVHTSLALQPCPQCLPQSRPQEHLLGEECTSADISSSTAFVGLQSCVHWCNTQEVGFQWQSCGSWAPRAPNVGAATGPSLSLVSKELSVYVYGAQGYFPLRELIDGGLNKATSFYLKEREKMKNDCNFEQCVKGDSSQINFCFLGVKQIFL